MEQGLAAAMDESRYRVRQGIVPSARVISGPQQRLWDVISTLRAEARREILSFDDTSFLIRGGVPESVQRRGPATLRSALQRGATVRQITSRSGLQADRSLGAIVHRAGGQARVIDSIPFKLSIMDRRVAVLAVNRAVLADGFHLIRDPELIGFLVRMHRDAWGRGVDPDHGRGDLAPELAVLLPALASGETDEVACRRLGISPRTYSRRVAELLTALGVQNRFQAGVEATRRGWL